MSISECFHVNLHPTPRAAAALGGPLPSMRDLPAVSCAIEQDRATKTATSTSVAHPSISKGRGQSLSSQPSLALGLFFPDAISSARLTATIPSLQHNIDEQCTFPSTFAFRDEKVASTLLSMSLSPSLSVADAALSQAHENHHVTQISDEGVQAKRVHWEEEKERTGRGEEDELPLVKLRAGDPNRQDENSVFSTPSFPSGVRLQPSRLRIFGTNDEELDADTSMSTLPSLFEDLTLSNA
ncbi:hypothetical protein FA10DRAFT_146111 [Acaromyces ingoldii]|uniref:Uncharacterized protein n=1 Tax=Acaromyces ingoldii TaxID=215250 RepID=A0A316YLE3_9BASI|nr:hypothetical protein FA10DRAFT_146111 [Acaromyces ingoldii]PWN89478.1 hypothetical protein FA10DRAFT_146111 [Acaromyces ingoldii]